MYDISFPPVQEEVALSDFIPQNYLIDYKFFFVKNVNLFSLEEKLVLISLDRDGYFFGIKKPAPSFLRTLWKFGIYLQVFSVFNSEKTVYSCFLKTFIVANPKFKPSIFLKNI